MTALSGGGGAGGGAGGGIPGGGGGAGGGGNIPSPILPVSDPDVPSWKLRSANPSTGFSELSWFSGMPSGVAKGVWYWEPGVDGAKPLVVNKPASFSAASASVERKT